MTGIVCKGPFTVYFTILKDGIFNEMCFLVLYLVLAHFCILQLRNLDKYK